MAITEWESGGWIIRVKDSGSRKLLRNSDVEPRRGWWAESRRPRDGFEA